VAAVVGSIPGASVTVNLAPIPMAAHTFPPCPGLRTQTGNEYFHPLSGTLAIGSLADWKLLPVGAPESIRCVFGDLGTPATNVNSTGVAVVIYVAYRSPDRKSAGLIDVVQINDSAFVSYSLLDRPDQRRQMPYHNGWIPTTQAKYDYPPGLLPLMVSALDGNGNLDPAWAMSKAVNPLITVPFVEGGYWGYIVTQVGSKTPGSDLLMTLQT